MSYLLRSLGFSLLTLPWLGMPQLALAQSIVPNRNDAGTIVTTPQSNHFNITGGTPAGSNLFHSFQRFGLSPNQTATFLANPTIHNVLGRVTGGDASVIQGLIRLTNSSANLYLINPAGIVFGSQARLDVPGSFTATTAHAIGVGNQWFNAVGSNTYQTLAGTPQQFALTQAGAIVNAGHLSVGQGQSITLLGGTVLNTGSLTAPNGQVTIAAIPGQRLVRVTQSGSLLSLELPTAIAQNLPALPYTPATLPQLLTGGNLTNANQVTVHPDGTVSLLGSRVTIPTQPGTAIGAGTLSTTAPVQTPSQIHVLGQQVALDRATLKAPGGTILVGGDFRGQGTVPNAQQTYVSQTSLIDVSAGQQGNGGRAIVWADRTAQFYGTVQARGGSQSGHGGLVEVSGKQHLTYRGTTDTSSPRGQVGTLLLDPTNITIRNGSADGNDNGASTTAFGNNAAGDNGQVLAADPIPTIIYESELEGMTGVNNLILEASNTIQIENLADDTLLLPPAPNQVVSRGSIRFRADADGNGVGDFIMNQGDTIRTNARDIAISGANITTGDIRTVGAPLAAGSVQITGATIRTGDIRTGSGFGDTSSVRLTATQGDVIVDSVSAGSGGIDIRAARYFRAVGAPIEFLRLILEPAEDGDLIQFLSRGNPDLLQSLGLLDGTQVFINLPVSVQTFPGAAGTGLIRIRHGGQAQTIGGSGPVQIQGTGAFPNVQFVSGPQNDHTIDAPARTFSGFSTLYPLNGFPGTLSGTTGAIVRRGGDATLITSFQNRPFDPSVPTTPPGTGTGGGGGTTGGGTTTITADGQTVQRQLNGSQFGLTCNPTLTASRPEEGRNRTATVPIENPCQQPNDDQQILKILDGSSR